jgi:hypothetical protein
MPEAQLEALRSAWTITTAIAVLLTGILALSSIWDTRVYLDGLRDALAMTQDFEQVKPDY